MQMTLTLFKKSLAHLILTMSISIFANAADRQLQCSSVLINFQREVYITDQRTLATHHEGLHPTLRGSQYLCSPIMVSLALARVQEILSGETPFYSLYKASSKQLDLAAVQTINYARESELLNPEKGMYPSQTIQLLNQLIQKKFPGKNITVEYRTISPLDKYENRNVNMDELNRLNQDPKSVVILGLGQYDSNDKTTAKRSGHQVLLYNDPTQVLTNENSDYWGNRLRILDSWGGRTGYLSINESKESLVGRYVMSSYNGPTRQASWYIERFIIIRVNDQTQ